MTKPKNGIRCAPAPFETELQLVTYNDNQYGHLVSEGQVLPEMRGDSISVKTYTRVLQHVPAIPVGAYMTVAPARVEKDTLPEFDFFIFESDQPYLFVRNGAPPADPTAVQATIGTISTLGTPWLEFLLHASDEKEPVWRINVPVESLSLKAAELLEAGYLVACSGVAAFTRVKGMQLKWITDASCTTDMSTIADMMPGMAASCGTYTDDFQIQRPMLFWGMLAGCQDETEADKFCEPLKSYVNTLKAVKAHRRETGGIESFDRVKECLKYNIAAKPSIQQQQHATTLFYWACIHGRPPVDKDHYRHALNMYLMFGYVMVRKRSYEFHVVEKRSKLSMSRKAPWVEIRVK